MGFLQTQKGFFICILIPMAIFFLFELYKFIFAVMEVKKAGNNSDLDEEEIKRRAIEEYLAEKEQEENTAKNSEES